MNPYEIRLGDLIRAKSDRVVESVCSLESDKINGCSIDYYEGIPLQEDWYIKLGFEKGEIEHPVFGKLDAWHISTNGTDCEYFCIADGKLWSNGFLSKELECVHHIQGLWFCQTGTELTPKI